MEPKKPELSAYDVWVVSGGGQNRVHRIARAAEQAIARH
jgi:hypothetical protein